ncbi:DNA ligase D [Roseococcus pinisoli]|uniref:DNA ligase (ATP) n=1 Tax=Roseococcus pinisoli TaxID=2835040 RepID=A0ABS5Q9P0_9PROT|nr:DNA ligase D [Roseococcus pinisoli]MBS7810435.1 DNA ligase D [Roseococcus pinisoli]
MAVSADKLGTYRAKRDFSRSPEPQGGASRRSKAVPRLAFVVQKHDATRLHYDFRLEWEGVLKSWAVTRGPSLDPADKRLAVRVEDHPLDYGSFEGVIPAPGYGAGTVMLWDRGFWAPLDPEHVDRDLAAGELKFVVSGERLKGGFVLVRLKPKPGEKAGRENWLLIKEKDSMATPGEGDAVLKAEKSVKTGRSLAQIAKKAPGEDEVWHSAPKADPVAASAKRAASPKAAKAKPEGLPDFLPPQLCQLVSTPPEGKNWIHELKLDGYRLQLRVEKGRVALRTRTGLDWTQRFPSIAKEAASLPDGIIDGEAVALDADNQPSFGALQAVLAGERKAPLLYWAFDLLHNGKRDLRSETQLARKKALKAHLPAKGQAIRYLDHFTQPGEAVLASACRLHMEGIVSKRADAPYTGGRGMAWTKAKCRGRDEFLIGGWSLEKRGQGRGLGSLLMGAMRDGKLVYMGRVGTGFSGAMGAQLMGKLEPLRRKTSPFVGAQPARLSDALWAEPKLVAEIAYGGLTEEGILRHASFQGLREDKPAREVTPPPEAAAPPAAKAPAAAQASSAARAPGQRAASGPSLTHPDKVLWPATETTPAVTKGELGAYYARFAERILAEVAGRPISVLRAPDGIGHQLFFQRHAMPGQSPLIRAVPIEGQPKPYMRIDDAAGLAALAQVSAVEIHPWGARADRPETPDRLIFDLDPAPELGFDAVVKGALELRERLKGYGLAAFPRVTGGKGLHLVVPLAVPARGEAPDWPQAKQFARLVCAMMEQDAPKLYTTTMAKKARTGRIFLDYLRNDRLSTAIANWSPRGREGAPVAHPIKWAEVKPGLDPAGLRLPALLEAPLPKDPWTGFDAAAGSLREAMEKATR